MFQNLGERLQQTIRNIRGLGRLTEQNIEDTLREVRISLLEADVAFPVVQQFIETTKVKALGQDVMKSLTPGQALVKIVQDELIQTLGQVQEPLDLNHQPPIVILIAGLQGAGKTTTSAKLAKLIQEKLNKKPMLVSTDVYRPAAIEQLRFLAEQLNIPFYMGQPQQKPTDIAQQAIDEARRTAIEVVIIDTAGRLHVDAEMMQEIKQLHQVCDPKETLFVIDSMVGQDAVNTAKAFADALPLTGCILTKADGDARGGAALSVKMVTGKPIKFIGTGEKIDAFEVFHPDRIAARILGMGDIISIVEEAQQKVDKAKAEKLAKKIKKDGGFDFEDFREQMLELNKMGGLMSLVSKIPGMSQLPQAMRSQMDDKLVGKTVAIINSMTIKERRKPDVINGSRKRRIAVGSGTTIQEVNKLIKQFEQMQKMMKKMSKGGNMMKMLSKFPGASMLGRF